MFFHPDFLLHDIIGVQPARQFSQVLAGVIEIDYLNRVWDNDKTLVRIICSPLPVSFFPAIAWFRCRSDEVGNETLAA